MSNVGGLLVGFSTRFFFSLRFQTFIANDESSYSYGSPFMTKVTLFSFHFLWLLVNEIRASHLLKLNRLRSLQGCSCKLMTYVILEPSHEKQFV